MTSTIASAPGKFVILGEHAVVYGKPAISLAIDKRFTIEVCRDSEFKVNGESTNRICNPHMNYISSIHGNVPVSVNMGSDIPPGSGLGSSAALSVAFSAALRSLICLDTDAETIAKESFDAEYYAQGRGSPMDTSTSVHGYGIALNNPDPGKNLWTIEKNGNKWDISDIDVPEMTFVIGYTGIRAPTGPLVERVRRYREKNKFASDIIDEIGSVSLEGMKALTNEDVSRLGELMTYNHKLLSILGVSCKELNKLVDVALPYSYGAKLTGSGGGGCMVALTDDPETVSEAISSRGGSPMVVTTGVEGVKIYQN